MDQEIKNEFRALRDFLREHMVTKQEFEERFETLPTREDSHQLLTAVDGIAKEFKDQGEEILAISDRTSRMEAWITQAAQKIGLDYKP